MPVKVRGDKSTHQYLVVLAGGPAGDGLVYRDAFPVFKQQLEEYFRVVYYDQRGAGNCQGRYDTSTLNLSQLADDLDNIIFSLAQKDPKAEIYLLGYSFGTSIGAQYLLDRKQQKNVKGFISIAITFDRKLQASYQEQLIEEWLKQWVKEGYIPNYEAMKTGFTCQNKPNPMQCQKDSISVVSKANERLAQIGSLNEFKVNLKRLNKLLSYSFFSQSNPILSGINEGHHGVYFQKEYTTLLLTPEMGQIQIPCLLLHGRYDTNAPYLDAKKAYEQLGTPPDSKQLQLLESSGHLPFLTEPKVLLKYIIDFTNAPEK